MRMQSKERLQNRKTEREILQFKSNQYLEEDGIDQIGEIAVNEPELFDEMATKRAKSYKDPSMAKQPNMQLWNAINQLPTKQLSKILRPKIIEKDKNAAEIIMQKIDQEKHIEQLQNQWFVQNRQETRQKFIDRHEKNIQLEKKAGIQKEYQPIVSDQNTLRMNQGSGVSIPNRPVSAYNINPTAVSSHKNIHKISNLLAKNSQQSEGQVTFRQKDNQVMQGEEHQENQNIYIQDLNQQHTNQDLQIDSNQQQLILLITDVSLCYNGFVFIYKLLSINICTNLEQSILHKLLKLLIDSAVTVIKQQTLLSPIQFFKKQSGSGQLRQALTTTLI